MSPQTALPFTGGWHVGPLFVVRKCRPLVRPHGKQGVVHRAQTVRATPAWADTAAIKALYAEARRKTIETGELHVVDHIIPKINPFVCGLHVHQNMRVVHWRANAIKGAAWGPGEQLEMFQ